MTNDGRPEWYWEANWENFRRGVRKFVLRRLGHACRFQGLQEISLVEAEGP